jgi:hypothetical protein
MPKKHHPDSLSRVEHRQTVATAKSRKVLHLLTDQLAVLLLQIGTGPSEFHQILKQSFVQAASNASRLQNGRVNASKVSAITGLARSEVASLLALKGKELPPFQRPPAFRVIDGWRSDQAFRHNNGKPRPLPLKAGRGSFQALAFRYAGDIPHKPILDELVRLGHVRILGAKAILQDLPAEPPEKVLRSLVHLFEFMAPALSQSALIAADGGRIEMRQLEINGSTAVESRLLFARTTEIIDAAISAVSELNSATRKNSPPPFVNQSTPDIYVSVALLKYDRSVRGKSKKRVS